MDFKEVSQISALLARDYARDFLTLLVRYRDISASEAASRLDLHVKTSQDFLEGLRDLDIVKREEVYEKKRPYFRYKLKRERLAIEIDLSSLHDPGAEEGRLSQGIRERKNAQVIFTTSEGDDSISAVTVFTGKGRNRREKKISLTSSQGSFLYHLPFPSADAISIRKIMEKAGVDKSYTSEILDIVELLEKHEAIEVR